MRQLQQIKRKTWSRRGQKHEYDDDDDDGGGGDVIHLLAMQWQCRLLQRLMAPPIHFDCWHFAPYRCLYYYYFLLIIIMITIIITIIIITVLIISFFVLMP